MQLGHPLVVAPEKSREVLGQILFVVLGESTHNAKVQGDVAPQRRGLNADLNVARVHVGMEKPIAKHLGKEEGDAIAGQLFHVHARSP